MKKRFLIPLLIILILAVLAWSPWITPAYAEKRAGEVFTAAWQGVIDGCGLNCKDCGAKAARKTWFGYRVQIEYACGLLPEDSPEYHRSNEGFVSFLGTVHGFPGP